MTRQATAADAAIVMSLYNGCFEAGLYPPIARRWDHSTAVRYLERYRGGFIAELDGVAMGFVGCVHPEDQEREDPTEVDGSDGLLAWLPSLAGEAQEDAVGRAMAALCRWLRGFGIERLVRVELCVQSCQPEFMYDYMADVAAEGRLAEVSPGGAPGWPTTRRSVYDLAEAEALYDQRGW